MLVRNVSVYVFVFFEVSMKDDDYYGFSTARDYKVVDLAAYASEDDFKVVDLLDFDTEDDVRIVNLSDVHTFQNVDDEDTKCIRGIDQVDRRTSSLQSCSALKSRCSRGRHIVKSAVVAMLVMTVLLVFTGNFSLVRSLGMQSDATSASSAIQPPITAAPISIVPIAAEPLIIDADRFYIAASLAPVRISIDGHSLLHVPTIGVDPPVRFPAGRHLLIWRTDRNRTFGCTMTVPSSISDTCEYVGPTPLQNGVAVWIIAFPHFKDEMP